MGIIKNTPDQGPVESYLDKINTQSISFVLVSITLLISSKSILNSFEVTMFAYVTLGSFLVWGLTCEEAKPYRQHMESYWYGKNVILQAFLICITAPIFILATILLSGIAAGALTLG